MGSLAQAVMLGYVFGREKNEALAPWTARRAETRPNAAAIISFFSYRYFRDYTYYDLIESAYESVTLSAFL